ncbi:MAG: hypothetical protein AAGH76_02850 [Pseudomonadota bacterium]
MTNSVSRRAFVRLPVALATLLGVASCAPRRSDEVLTHVDLIRAADQLALSISFTNLKLVPRRHKPDRLVPIDPASPATVAIGLPPQHVAEAVWQTSVLRALPVESVAASEMQLVFQLPVEMDGLDLSVESLLDWSRLEIVWSANDGLTEAATRIETPTGLLLNVPTLPASAWRHAHQPVTWHGRTELWHTQLSDLATNQSAMVVLPREPNPMLDELATSLTPSERAALSGRTVQLRELMLSPSGAWLDVRGQWEGDTAIARWEHRVVAGRDSLVETEGPPGHLFPFGHRAAIVTVNERQATNGGVATLNQHRFIVIKDPVVNYPTVGAMPFQSIRLVTTATPPLVGVDTDAAAFWIDTGIDQAFDFLFEATDWDGAKHQFSAAAVYATIDGYDAAVGLYADENRAAIELDGQATVVTPFDGSERQPARTQGDTTLQLLNTRLYSAGERDDDTNRFDCRVEWIEARVPALEPYLDAAENRGRFRLDDPSASDNVGEIFATAVGDARIPLSFRTHADQVGGLITPAMVVDGLSRTQGPVGDADAIRRNQPIDPATYFTDDAKLLGVFSLSGDVFASADGRPAYVPQFVMSVVPDPPQAVDEEDAPDEDKDDGETSQPQSRAYTITTALKWSFDMPEFEFLKIVRVSSVAEKQASIAVSAMTQRRIGDAPIEEQDASSDESSATQQDDTAKQTDWKVAASANNFALALKVDQLGGLAMDVTKLEVTLGPRPPKKDADASADDKPDNDEPDDDEESSIKPEFHFELGDVRGTGALAFINPIMAALKPPPAPPLEFGEPSAVFPATLPDAGDADVSVNVGPFVVPDFKWLQFDVSNISIGLGVGFYFFPRGGIVPDPLFTLRVASADRPITLTSLPWGGTAHLALNVTPRAVTGVQFSVGVVYRAEFDLGITKALCSGSLSGVFTYYEQPGDAPFVQTDFVIRLQGSARLAGFIDVALGLTAVGTWQQDACYFHAEIVVGVQAAFFSVTVTVRFNHELRNADPDRLSRDGPQDRTDYTKEEWLAWRQAFAA